MDRNRLRYRIREPGGNATAHPLTRARLNDHDSAREISWEVATSLASKCNPDARFQRGGSGFRRACYRARFARPVGSIRAKLSPPDRLICPTGCSGSSAVQPLLQKYFCFRATQIKSISIDVPPHRGALAIVTNAGWDAVDAAAPARRMRSQGGFPVSGHDARRRTALKRTAKSCGPDASTPASSLRRHCRPDRRRQSHIRRRR